MSYPPLGGSPLRNWQNINIMSKFGAVGVFSVFDEDSQPPNISAIDFWHHYNLKKIPTPYKQLELISWWLNQRGLRDYWAYRDSAAKELKQILSQFKPDLVIIEELWLYPYLKIVKNYPCKIIFDNHNLESQLFEKIQCGGQGLRSWLRRKIHLPQIQRDEQSFLRQAQQVWLCSEKDKSLLENLYGLNAHSYVIPNGIDVSYYEGVKLGQCLRALDLNNNGHNLLFIGTFSYLPNAEAAYWLMEEIYPQLRQIYSDCCLLLVGLNPTPIMKKAAQENPQIIVTGKVADIRHYLAINSVVVAPLKNGSGTRLKILEAFASRCPVVSTSKASEGLEVQDGEHLLIRDDVKGMVESIIQLWQKPQFKHKLVDSAYQLVKSQYSWENVSQKIAKAAEIFDDDFFPHN